MGDKLNMFEILFFLILFRSCGWERAPRMQSKKKKKRRRGLPCTKARETEGGEAADAVPEETKDRFYLASVSSV